VHCVVALNEINWRRPSVGYGVNPEILDNNWIVYLNGKAFAGITSITMVILDRNTGSVLYFGSAHDEG